MPEDPPDFTDKEISYYYALAQAGLEMVGPLLIGLGIDYYFGTLPWATVVGTVLGFVGGFFHLIMMITHHDSPDRSKKPDRGSP
ncbi:MAG TPA: AtpZ/AtpI family protein [Gemmataceae bacterium]|jgi:F0F1-type ATP synthase assembly protein I|nr:AtpZ/AtpI family protein [Gemmataceae bacterium]